MLAETLSALTLFALCYTALAWTLTWRRRPPMRAPGATSPWPGVTILKPLHGLEPDLRANLSSFCRQDYPACELVLGVERADDPALPTALAVQAENPQVQVRISRCAAGPGQNPKVRNLGGMLPLARHDILLLTDADTSVDPDFLRQVVEPLGDPAVGAVTCLYRGVPGNRGLCTHLLTAFVNGWFIPAVRVGSLGRRSAYGLGAAIAVRRSAFEAIGGLAALQDHLSDDFVLARRVEDLGYRVALGRPIVRTTLLEPSFRDFWHHLVRWMHASRVARPWGFAFSFLMYPVGLSVLALAAGAGSVGLVLLGLGYALRLALLARGNGRQLPLWQLPLLALPVDLLCFAAWAAAIATRDVRWHGRRYRLGPDGRMRLRPHQKGPRREGAPRSL